MEQINLNDHYRQVCALQEQENELEAIQQFIAKNQERLQRTVEGTAVLEAARLNEMSLQEGNAQFAARIAQEEKRIEEALIAFEDVRGRTILRLHFLKGMPWGTVAAMNGKSEPGVKSFAYRQIKKVNAVNGRYRFLIGNPE